MKFVEEEGYLHIKKYNDGSITITPEILIENKEELSEIIAAIHLLSGYLSVNLNYISEAKKIEMINEVNSKMKNNHLKLVVNNTQK